MPACKSTNISRIKCLYALPRCGIPCAPCGFPEVSLAGITVQRSFRDLRIEILHSQLYCTGESVTLSSAAMSSASSATLALQKGLPASEDAERFILGSVLLDDSRFIDIAGIVTNDDFVLEKHRRIFARIDRKSTRLNS